ncbi:MAG: M14 family zinc carboxypeptidase [Myxococcota bacterium]
MIAPHLKYLLALAALSVGLVFASGTSFAAIVPPYDADRELTHLTGRLSPTGGALLGGWKGDNKGNRLQAPKGGKTKWGTWFPSGPGTTLENGTVRLRLRASKKVDAAVFLRAAYDDDGKVVDGYRVRLRGRTLDISRIKKGRVRRVSKQESVSRWPSGLVELVVTAMGPDLLVQAWDARKKTFLGAVHARDRTFTSGHVGVASRRGKDSQGRFVLLATRDACERTPPTRGGPHIYLTVEKGKVPEGTLPEKMESLTGFPRRDVWRADTLGMERLACANVTPHKLSLEEPWKYKDPAYRKWRRFPPKVKDGRMVLNRSYKNPDMVNATLQMWHELYPELTWLEKIGRSREGREIYAMAIGRRMVEGDDRPTIFVNGAHHGNEVLSAEFVLDHIAQLLEGAGSDAKVDRWLDNFVVWAVPVVNPDGLHAFLEVSSRTGRKNGHDHNKDGKRGRYEGVDLNRNYPFRWGSLGEKGSRSRKSSVYYRGTEAASEPEVQAVMKLAERERFLAALTYHTGTVAVLAPYTIDGATDPKVNEAWTVAEELVRTLPRHPQGRDFKVKRNLYPVDGTDQDWHRFANGTLALLIEGARHTPAVVKKRNKIVKSVRPGLGFLMDRFLDGPSLTVYVVDLEGKPIQAEVRIVEMAPENGEVWKSRCPSGRYDRYLPEVGTWNLEVLVPGMEPHRVAITADDARHHEMTIHVPVTDSAALQCPVRWRDH